MRRRKTAGTFLQLLQPYEAGRNHWSYITIVSTKHGASRLHPVCAYNLPTLYLFPLESSPNSTWLITSLLDMTQHVKRVERVLTSVSSRACSNMADVEEAVGLVLACTSLVFCALDLHQSGTTSGKSEVDMSTPVHAVATPLNKCRASRAHRNERLAPCCPTSATSLVTSWLFPSKCLG